MSGWTGRCAGFLPKEVVLDDAVNGPKTVLPDDLLPLRVGPAVVGDSDLVDRAAHPGDLGSDLRFEAEALFLDVDALNDIALECLVAGLDVGEIQIRQHVGEQRQKTVAHAMPEVEDAVRLVPHEARAVNDVCL